MPAPSALPTRSLALVGAGGAAGTALRYATTLAVEDAGGLPLATLLVNLAGAFALGVLVAAAASAETRLLLGTGLLGGFTTYSALAVEVEGLRQDDPTLAVAYALATVAGGYVLSLTGLALGRRWRR